MIEWLGDTLMAVVTGGATGILGSAVQSYSNYKNKQLEAEQENRRLEHDAKMVQLESQAQINISQQEAAAQAEQSAFVMQTASYGHDARSYMPDTGAPAWIIAALGVVDVLRGLIRPGLTAYFAVAVSFILFEANGLLSDIDGITATERLATTTNIWATLLYVATTIFFWWFGQRPPKRN
ncbi:hypothetical protein [Alteromonas sp. RKMC-009]|uniref:hypothetical protein n=1 Tax=Alteromonas sp. RKMC-009 TaxID=2267264 RepID=UPI000E692DEA|nr:hypothetical protein [Alteromonas sp. RKMC-009]AYA63840.1 hypothetical protein DS731_07400 [Alteromonas sp. RKMC-009]